MPRLVSYIVKVVWQTICLAWILFWIVKPKFYLVQNPPSVPCLPVCWFISKIRGAKLVVDWHNYGMKLFYKTLVKFKEYDYVKVITFYSKTENLISIKKIKPLNCIFLGYTILGLALGPKHFLVLCSRFLEAFFGRRANINFCVSKAMSQDLQENWSVQ